MSSSHDLSVKYDEKEKEFKELLNQQYLVEVEIAELSKKIVDLQSKKRDYEIMKLKATHSVRVCRIDLDLLKNAFFQAKASGL